MTARHDYGQVAATLDQIRRTSGAFSTRHRTIDTHGGVHHVVVVGDQIYDDGAVIGTHGFCVDVTPSIKETQDEVVTEAVAESRRRVAVANRPRACSC